MGHVISSDGVATDPEKISTVANWQTPSSTKELHSFLGLAGYYRKFVRHFGIIAKPLTELLRKNTIFSWTSIHEQSFKALKSALCSVPVLALPDFTKPFSIETEACVSGIGVVLAQEGHPLAFISKSLGPRTSGLSTYKKEYLAVIMVVQQWSQYLQFAEFTIYTDQQSLVQLIGQRLHTVWQQKLLAKLLGLQYRIVYKPGTTKCAANALSHKSVHDSSCAAVLVVAPQWIQEVVAGYAADPSALDMIAKLSIDPQAIPGFSLQDGVLRYQNKIWSGVNSDLQRRLLEASHSSALGGHTGFPMTYMWMKQLFAWKGMNSAVREYVRCSVVC